MKPELISFDLCPFVQRSVITLLEKDVPFDITYIDLSSPPQWFLNISPFGKVPVLRVDDETLFESAVINEYLDDITPPSLHPSDPLTRAINKAWIEFASEMLGAQYRYCVADTKDIFDRSLGELRRFITQLSEKLNDGPFFNGNNFALIDAAFAPFFTRTALLESFVDNNLYNNHPDVAAWSEALISRNSVINSVKPDFSEKYMKYIRDIESYAATVFKS